VVVVAAVGREGAADPVLPPGAAGSPWSHLLLAGRFLPSTTFTTGRGIPSPATIPALGTAPGSGRSDGCTAGPVASAVVKSIAVRSDTHAHMAQMSDTVSWHCPDLDERGWLYFAGQPFAVAGVP
jgi:hypothetical protein